MDGYLQWDWRLIWNVLHGESHEKIQKTLFGINYPIHFPLHRNWIQRLHKHQDAWQVEGSWS